MLLVLGLLEGREMQGGMLLVLGLLEGERCRVV
jgi:hypothetical protein